MVTWITPLTNVAYQLLNDIVPTYTHFITACPLLLCIDESATRQFFDRYMELETSINSSKESQMFREYAATLPGVPETNSLRRGFTETRTGTDTKGEAYTNTTVRERDIRMVCVTLLVFVLSIFIAYAPNRDELLGLVRPGQNMPVYLKQFVQKVRSSDTRGVQVRPSGCKYVYKDPAWKDTFLDYDYVITRAGFMLALEFFNSLANASGNYIEFFVVSEATVSRELPSLNSGTQRTFTSIFSLAIIAMDVISGEIWVDPINSFPAAGIAHVHALDAISIWQRAFKNKDLTEPYSPSKPFEQSRINLSSDQLILFLIKRVCGVITNSSGMSDDPSDQIGAKPKGRKGQGVITPPASAVPTDSKVEIATSGASKLSSNINKFLLVCDGFLEACKSAKAGFTPREIKSLKTYLSQNLKYKHLIASLAF